MKRTNPEPNLEIKGPLLMKYLFTTATVIKCRSNRRETDGVSPMNDPQEAVRSRSIRRPTAFCDCLCESKATVVRTSRPEKGVAKYVPTTALARVAARQHAKRLCHCSTKLSYADESTAGLEPATHGLRSEVCLIYGTCLYYSEATSGEDSELHQ